MFMSHLKVIACSCFFSLLIATPAVLAQGLPGGGGPNGPVPGPTICYVDDGGSVTNDCTSWGDACSELQIALDKADQGDCEQIWVAAGSYRPDYDLIFGHVGSKSMTFQLLDGVEIYGGLVGNESSSYNLDNRDLVTNETFLTGDLHGDDGPADFEDYDNNSYHVVTGSGTDDTALIDGFTIIGGNAVDSPSDTTGGGMLIVEGAATVSQCKFELNSAEDEGGGLSIEDTNGLQNQPTVVDCHFVNNRSTDAGGGGLSLDDSSPTVAGCTFEDNHAFDGGGGGMSYASGSNPIIDDCTFTDNSTTSTETGSNGGGLLGQGSTAPIEITNCTFQGNSSFCSGGGAAVTGSNILFENCDFISNNSQIGAGGLRFAGTAEIRTCLFQDNTIEDSQSQITGSGGGLVATTGATDGVLIVDSRFEGNQALQGAGADVEGEIQFINSQFMDNVVSGTDNMASAILGGCKAVGVTNCLFAGNNSSAVESVGSSRCIENALECEPLLCESPSVCIPQGLILVNSTFTENDTAIKAVIDVEIHGSVLWANSVADIDVVGQVSCTVGYSDLDDDLPTGCTDAGGLIGNNPMFVNAGAGDYRLDEDSPCIDAGDNTQVPDDIADLDGDSNTTEQTPYDLALNPRFVDDPSTPDSGNGDFPFVDMGAYEFQP